MTIYDFIEKSSAEVKDFFKKNKLNISSSDIKEYFDNLPNEEKEIFLAEQDEKYLRANYNLLVVNYTSDILKIDNLKPVDEIL